MFFGRLWLSRLTLGGRRNDLSHFPRITFLMFQKVTVCQSLSSRRALGWKLEMEGRGSTDMITVAVLHFALKRSGMSNACHTAAVGGWDVLGGHARDFSTCFA